MRAPKKNPCGSCPYRRDVPAGVWHPEEYDKLPEYDNETGSQPMAVFACHQQDDTMCSGWVGTHDMDQSMALRISLLNGHTTPEDYEAALDYECPVPLFGTGLEAAAHGISGVADPDERTLGMIEKLKRKREGRHVQVRG
jgi:hypothetical protein